MAGTCIADTTTQRGLALVVRGTPRRRSPAIGGTIAALAVLFASVVASGAEHWPGWRGPSHTGESDAADLPVTWDVKEGKNIRWRADLPGPSAATPIVWGDRAFVVADDGEAGQVVLQAFNLNSGGKLWSRNVGVSFGGNRRNDMASPSPVTDGKRVIVLTGRGDLCAFDLDGEELWRRNIQKDHSDGKFRIIFGYGASPLLHGGTLFVPVLQRASSSGGDAQAEASFLLGINPASGEDLFKTPRRTNAVAESQEAYSTPAPLVREGRTEIVITGGDAFTGHDAATGKELWRWEHYNERKINHWRIVVSPVPGEGMFYAAAPKRAPLFAIKLPAVDVATITKPANLSAEAAAWSTDDNPPDVCTPALSGDDLFVLDGDRQVLRKLDAGTGAEQGRLELDSKTVIRSSPTVADGKVYFIDERGTVFVVSAKDSLDLLDAIEMGGTRVRSSIAAVDRSLIIRTDEALFCIAAEVAQD